LEEGHNRLGNHWLHEFDHPGVQDLQLRSQSVWYCQFHTQYQNQSVQFPIRLHVHLYPGESWSYHGQREGEIRTFSSIALKTSQSGKRWFLNLSDLLHLVKWVWLGDWWA
jgi:hypothetical protein